jgi:hypothetical protein
VQHLKEHVPTISPTTINKLVTRFQAPVTTVDANMFRHVRENSMRAISVCLEMDGGGMEHLFELRGAHSLTV